MSFSRRSFMETMAAGTCLTTLSMKAYAHQSWVPRQEDLMPGPAFRHGVASGDPLHTRVILWTRITPIHGRPTVRVKVTIALDPQLKKVVYNDWGYTGSAHDFTYKFDAYHLKPGTTYYYQFSALGQKSPVGRTKTLPTQTDRVRLAVASCSNLPVGFFGAYAQIAKKENLDAVVHLGDYIYEYANAEYGDGTKLGRIPYPNKEITTLSDYRSRHAQYKIDPQLQAAHQAHPWIVVWDDHEIANDAYKDGAQNHQEKDEGSWKRRKKMATKAYFEWMPIRDNFGRFQHKGQIFRRFQFGRLLQLDMLDTRLMGRDKPLPAMIDPFTRKLLVDPAKVPELLERMNHPQRQLLGKRQEDWLYRQIEKSTERGTLWQVLGQQVMMGQLQLPLPKPFPDGMRVPLNTDQWDGYGATRKNLLQYLANQQIKNTVILTGDIHSSWFNDIAINPYEAGAYDPVSGKGSQAVEFVTPAITSAFFTAPNTPIEQIRGFEQQVLQNNPHTQYVDFEKRGYMVVDIDTQRAQGEWYHISTVESPKATEILAAKVKVKAGTNHGVLVPPS